MSSGGDPERGNAKRAPSPPRGTSISNGQPLPPPPRYRQQEAPSLHFRRHISWIVPLFLIANVVVFVVTMYVNDCPGNRNPNDDKCVWEGLKRFSFQPLRENPLLGPSGKTLEKMGSLQWEKVVHQHQGWRLVSCIWLHAGVIHLVVNMLSLAFIGIRLEQQFGFVRIGIIYLMSGFGGSILSALFLQNRSRSISVGASGAIFGLLGAMLSELLTNWTIYRNKVAAFITLITVIAINLVFGILPLVDNFAHIGGFLTGLFTGFILLMRPQFSWMEYRRSSKYNAFQLTSLTISLCFLIAGFVAVLVFLYREVNPNDHCKWCHYLSCVPTSNWKCDRDT